VRKSSPQLIEGVLKAVVEQLGQAKKKDIHKVISVWPEVAGRKLARHTQPVQLRKKVLMVMATESAWLYQANFYKEKLLASLQAKLGKSKVQDIQFRIGKRR
jgi:predicted nucleic acid-binding Zn ribbon protein